MYKRIIAMLAVLGIVGGFAACTQDGGKTNTNKSNKAITMVWYPNESGGDYEEARKAIGDVITKATGREVEHKLTTDYAIAIETMANNNAEIAFTGAQGYVEANIKNKDIQPVVVPSGASGTLDDAVYYSWISVREEEAKKYKKGDSYDIKLIQGEDISFVSNSSTSGFVVPASEIKKEFSNDAKWGSVTNEDLMQGGKDKFFKSVQFGGSHQGSAVNLLTNKSSVAAFCDTVMMNYVEAKEGKFNATGTKYEIKENAEDPFSNLSKKEFRVIKSIPVLNSPFIMNTSLLSADEQKAIIDQFTSDEVKNNKMIFMEEDSTVNGFFSRTDKEQFIAVKDEWFNTLREMK